MEGRATFLSLPRLTKILDNLPTGRAIRMHLAGLAQVDHTCAEVLTDWIQRRRKAGMQVELVGSNDLHESHPYRRLAEAANA